MLAGAAGFGGDQPHAADFAVLQLAGADAQRIDGAVHRVVGQTAAGRQPLAEADDAREGIDDAELARTRRLGDQQAAIVGAEIERRIKLIRPGMFGSRGSRSPARPDWRARRLSFGASPSTAACRGGAG